MVLAVEANALRQSRRAFDWPMVDGMHGGRAKKETARIPSLKDFPRADRKLSESFKAPTYRKHRSTNLLCQGYLGWTKAVASGKHTSSRGHGLPDSGPGLPVKKFLNFSGAKILAGPVRPPVPAGPA